MANLCLNFLADSFVNLSDMQRLLYPYLHQANNDAIQITSGARTEQAFELAQGLHRDFPQMEIVFRVLPDDHQHEKMTAQAWYDKYAKWSNGGRFTLSDNNEPGTGDLMSQNLWYAGSERLKTKGVLELAGRAGIKVATVNMQTHNNFDPSYLHETIELCALYQHRFSLHYYFGNGFPVDPVHKTLLQYCQNKGIRFFPFFITELGFCGVKINAEGKLFLDPYAGYDKRISSEDYADALVNQAMAYPDLKFFIYSWGGQAPWGEFDISEDEVLQKEVIIHNQKESVLPMPPPNIPTEGGVRSTLTKIPSSYINIRSQPGFKSDGRTPVGVDLGDLLIGDLCMVYPPDDEFTGWCYQTPITQVERPAGRADAIAGWVYLAGGAVEFTPIGTPVPPEGKVYITDEQYVQLKFHNNEITKILNAIATANGRG